MSPRQSVVFVSGIVDRAWPAARIVLSICALVIAGTFAVGYTRGATANAALQAELVQLRKDVDNHERSISDLLRTNGDEHRTIMGKLNTIEGELKRIK
jgi:hypothetical protein